MQRFLKPASGSISAVLPVSVQADRPDAEAVSVEQPGLQLQSIGDVKRWLAKEPIASCSTADMQRIREAAAVLSHKKPKQEDVEPLQSKWGVAQKKNKKRRPLEEVVDEFRDKVIKAAQQLQGKLSYSAEQTAASTVGQPGPTDTADGVDFDDEPWLAELKMRQRKRAQDSAAEEQRPHAKPKAAKRQKRRTAGTTFDSDEERASKRQDRCLTPSFFAASALHFSEDGAVSSSSAAQLVPVQQQRRYMGRLLHELKKLSVDGWVFDDDAKDALKEMISQTRDLQNIPATQKVLRQPSIRALYSSICGSLEPIQNEEQDRTRVTMIACYSLEEKVVQFVQAREEIEEYSKETYSWLWELKNRWHDAVLNSLPDMPRSPHEFIQLLSDSGASTHTPFGRFPKETQVKLPFFRLHVGISSACWQVWSCRSIDLLICRLYIITPSCLIKLCSTALMLLKPVLHSLLA